MVDKLIEVLSQVLYLFAFTTIVHDYERGIVLRFGRYNRTLEPGIHLIWPFMIEHSITDNVVTTTTNLGPQSLTTADGKSVTVGGVLTWHVEDVRKVLLECEGKQEAVLDTTLGVIARHVARSTFADLSSDKLARAITREVRRRAAPYGIAVASFQFTDLVACRPIRIWGQAPKAS